MQALQHAVLHYIFHCSFFVFVLFLQYFVFSMEIGNNGYHSERLQGIPNPVMTR